MVKCLLALRLVTGSNLGNNLSVQNKRNVERLILDKKAISFDSFCPWSLSTIVAGYEETSMLHGQKREQFRKEILTPVIPAPERY